MAGWVALEEADALPERHEKGRAKGAGASDFRPHLSFLPAVPCRCDSNHARHSNVVTKVVCRGPMFALSNPSAF